MPDTDQLLTNYVTQISVLENKERERKSDATNLYVYLLEEVGELARAVDAETFKNRKVEEPASCEAVDVCVCLVAIMFANGFPFNQVCGTFRNVLKTHHEFVGCVDHTFRIGIEVGAFCENSMQSNYSEIERLFVSILHKAVSIAYTGGLDYATFVYILIAKVEKWEQSFK